MEPKLGEKPSLTLTRHYPVAPEKVWRACMFWGGFKVAVDL